MKLQGMCLLARFLRFDLLYRLYAHFPYFYIQMSLPII